MKITFAKPTLPEEGALVVCVLEGRTLTPSATEVDGRTGGALTRAMAASRFEGKKDQTLLILAPHGLTVTRILLIGLGKAEAIDTTVLQSCGGAAVAALLSAGDAHATILVDTTPSSENPATGEQATGEQATGEQATEQAAQVAFGARLRSWRFDRYRTKEKPEDKPTLKKLIVGTPDPAAAKKAFEPLDRVADGILLTRTLVSEPANVIYPESFAAEAKKLADLGVEVEVLGEKQMKKLGMNALLAVGQGSEHASQLVVMHWFGAEDKKAKPVAFVGKGVTFDSGGISIKPAAGMEDMKWDMGGAGVVVGLMMALAGRKARVNAVGVVGMVENMPSGKAQRPGDIVTSLSGQTIEVINTDAEGRLVLADALWYCQETFKPEVMVDLATLTGAVMIALGSHHAGLFSTDDQLAARLTDAGTAVGERLWRLPLSDDYDKQIKSDAADMKNVGGREAGSITAAQFLKRFVNGVPWAHLDIAGVTWSKKDTAIIPKGATAFGLRLLDRFVAEHYEDK